MNDVTAPGTDSTAAAEAVVSENAPAAAKPSAALLRLVALAALWLIGAAFALYLKRSQLLLGFDGGYMLNLAQRQFAWHLPLFSAGMDWFQGLGDVYFGVNFRLLPSFIAGSFFSGTAAAKIAIYEIVLAELTVGIVLFALALGVSRAAAMAAAALTCLVFMPFAHPTLVYGILPLTPHMGSLVAAALLAGAAFLQFGRRNWRADLPYAAAALGLLAWSVLVSITIILLAAPFLLLCAVSGTIAAASPAERRCKLALLAAAVVLMLAGPAIYLVSTILDTAAVTFPAELANNRASFFYASILFQGLSVGWTGPLLILSGIAGAALAAFDRSRRTLRIFAITLLTYLGTRLTFAALIILFDFWRGPAPLYFEFFVIPLYAVFAVTFWADMLARLWRAPGFTQPSAAAVELRVVAAAVAAVVMLAVATPRGDYGFPYPPEPNPIVRILSGESGLDGERMFRGRTADMIGRSIPRGVDWLDLHGVDFALASAIGNELRLVGLNAFGVPSLFQYTPTVSPAFYALTSRLLALPDDRQMRNIVVLRKFDPRILAMLGVRYVITDRPYDGPAILRARMATGDRTLLLYEIARPNLGDFSPTVVTAADTAAGIIARLADPRFDPAQQIVADLPRQESGLVPARNARLTFLGSSLQIEAESDGRSILLLPLEYSHCVRATTPSTEKPLLFRANLLETGVLFSGRLDAVVSLKTGAFVDPACRFRDLMDVRALRIGEVAPLAPQATAGERH